MNLNSHEICELIMNIKSFLIDVAFSFIVA